MLTDADLTALLAAVEEGLSRDALTAALRAAVYGGRDALRVALEASHAVSLQTDATLIGGAEADGDGGLVAGDRTFERRYTLGDELGRGGAGRVVLASDQLFGRSVAIKLLLSRDPGPLRRFVTEARTTARLDHPGVVPVHDFGLLPDGTPGFAMKRVAGRSLKSILAGLASGDAATRAAFSRYRLLRILIAVGQAVDYAHAHGVVHRDLKPDNIMVGDFGEVLVMDWGVAKVLGESLAGELALPSGPVHGTLMGAIIGTPGYMPPEQARGEHDRIDGRADVWALGAILYEILTGQRPFERENGVLAVLVATSSRDVPPAGSVAAEIPSDLEEICARALAREVQHRHPTAGDFCADIEAYLTGTRELERRAAEADRLVTDGEESVWYLGMLRDEHAQLRQRLAEQPALTGQEPLPQKRERWAAEDRATALVGEQRQAFGWAEARLMQAIELVPSHTRARALLADLHWRRYREARAVHDPVEADEHLKAVARARPDDPRLHEPIVLRLSTTPPAAEVVLSRVVEQDRVLVRVAERSLGPTPISTAIPTGRSTLEIRVPGRRPVLLPLQAWQGDTLDFTVAAPTEAELGPDFVFVPGGSYVCGTDPEAILPRPAGRIDVPPFAIGRFPVMCGEYFEFLNSLPRAEALRHAPRSAEDGVLVAPGPQGWRFPCIDVDGDPWQPDWPIFNVSYEDAEAYAHWRSAREGVRYRLPTEDQWEKAARGTDGRTFPWGDHFDPTFCRMRTSVPGDLLPRAVGSYPIDCSPYGVMDLAGGVREWVDGFIEPGLRSARGGAFNHYAFLCRAASRFGYGPKSTIVGLGFRLVKELPGHPVR